MKLQIVFPRPNFIMLLYILCRIIIGLTQFTNKAHIARATLEATCFQTREVRRLVGLLVSFIVSLPKLPKVEIEKKMSNSILYPPRVPLLATLQETNIVNIVSFSQIKLLWLKLWCCVG